MRSIIFDLDLTLVDTTPLEQARADRNWQLAYSKISECHLYDGIQEILDVITKHHIPTAIVSTSPGKYVQNVTDYFHIPVDHIIGYHDAKPHKPAPAPMLLALQKLGCSADQAISFAYIAKNYFGKSYSWLIQRLNGSKVNGKEAHFNREEVLQLQSALNDLGKKLSSIVLL